jgi:hypothetical protein
MPLLAHHSVAAEFDMSRKITIQGTITGVEWKNPHARNTVLNRMFARPGAPNTDRDALKKGDQAGSTFWRAKDGSMLGCALSMVLADGRAVSLPGGWL